MHCQNGDFTLVAIASQGARDRTKGFYVGPGDMLSTLSTASAETTHKVIHSFLPTNPLPTREMTRFCEELNFSVDGDSLPLIP